MRPEDPINEIRTRVDIVDLVRDYVPSLKQAGRNFKACCPFHSERTPSFTVSQDKQIFYCFGCNKGGDVFTFLREIEGLSFPEAAERLAQRAGVEWKRDKDGSLSAREKERTELKKLMAAAAALYSKFLFSSSGKTALAYLRDRQLSDKTIERFMLGWAPGGDAPVARELKARGFSADLLFMAGLASTRDGGRVGDYFRERVMFPIRNPAGEVIAFGGRVLDSSEPKYLNSPETVLFPKRRTLYGLYEALPEIRKKARVAVVEGYMDVIACHQAGAAFAVAPLGTALTSDHAHQLSRYSAEITVAFDSDTAGRNAAVRAAEIFMDAGLYVKAADFSPAKDPDELAVKSGAAELEKRLVSGMDPVEFKLRLLAPGGADKLSSQDKARLAAKLLDTVGRQRDEIVKSEWLRIIAAKLAVPEEALARQLSKSDPGGHVRPERPAEAPADLPPAIELGFLQLLLRNPGLFGHIGELPDEHLSHRDSRAVLAAMRAAPSASPAELSASLAGDNPEAAALVMKLSVQELESESDPAADVRKTAEMITRFARERRWKELKSSMASLGPDQLREFQELTAEIKSSPGKKK